METILLLPAAGKALRMGGVIKELLPLGPYSADGKVLPSPVIARSLDIGVQCGVDRCLIVTSTVKAPALMDAISALKVPFPVAFIHQTKPAGLGWGIHTAEPHVRPDDIILMAMPDTAMRPTDVVTRAVQSVRQGSLACATLFRVDEPHRFGVAELVGNNAVGFKDKPQRPASQWIWTSIAFRFDLFAYLRRALEANLTCFTSAMDLAAKDGKMFVEFADGGSYWDIGTYDDYLRALAEFSPGDRDHPSEKDAQEMRQTIAHSPQITEVAG